MSISTSSTAAHVLVYPFPTSGHIIPLLDLAHRLLNRGLIVTVLVTPNNLTLLDPLFSVHPSSQLQKLVLPAPDQLPRSSNRLIAIMRFLRDRHYPLLLDWFQSHASPPVAIISDFFLGWTHEFASEVGVPRIVFSPSGAFAYSVSSCLWRDQPQNPDPENLDFTVSLPEIPNCPTYPWWQISLLYRIPRDSDWELLRNNYTANAASWGTIINSFNQLEGVYLDHLKGNFKNGRVWAVGPLLPSDDDFAGTINRGGSSSVPCHDVLTWLDSRADQSVVYVCFGSRTSLTCKQMDALAAALDKSKVNFIWCVRQPVDRHASSDYGELPDGFEDRVAGRGFVIKGWAPQVAILRHRAIGSFLSHCGWNSVLEGIASGVVIMTWPMGADQFSNAQLLVDQLRVGIRVGEDTHHISEPDDLARKLAESVEQSRAERVNAKKLQEAAIAGVEKGGSSDADLDELVKTLNELKIKT